MQTQDMQKKKKKMKDIIQEEGELKGDEGQVEEVAEDEQEEKEEEEAKRGKRVFKQYVPSSHCEYRVF